MAQPVAKEAPAEEKAPFVVGGKGYSTDTAHRVGERSPVGLASSAAQARLMSKVQASLGVCLKQLQARDAPGTL